MALLGAMSCTKQTPPGTVYHGGTTNTGIWCYTCWEVNPVTYVKVYGSDTSFCDSAKYVHFMNSPKLYACKHQ